MDTESVFKKKMVFIYNALNDGWTVKKVVGETYIFKKENNQVSGNLNEFIQKNLIALDSDVKRYRKNSK